MEKLKTLPTGKRSDICDLIHSVAMVSRSIPIGCYSRVVKSLRSVVNAEYTRGENSYGVNVQFAVYLQISE